MSDESRAILKALQGVLTRLSENPYPHVPTPEGCKKRASVAAIIRVRPAFKPVPPANGSVIDVSEPPSPPSTIEEFFSQDWVQEGDPELLFIKRAGRPGDRWSGHTALPGGMRDPEDADDLAAAVRETREEIGLDLDTSECLRAGNLPERLVTTTWGKDTLMVLCPYVFLLTGKTVSALQPQPTEVAAVHWVPLRGLLSPTLRTREFVDISSRMAKHVGPVIHKVLRFMMGKMMFSAVKLVPAESVYASSISGFIPTEGGDKYGTVSGWAQAPYGVPESSKSLAFQQPILLWGLTLGVLADFLDQLPPYNAVKLWKYPTFTVPDLRFLVYLFTRDLRRNTADTFSSGSWPNHTAIDTTTEAVPVVSDELVPTVSEAEPIRLARRESLDKHRVGIGGLGVGPDPKHAVGKMLAGYYEKINVAIAVFFVYRTFATAGVAFYAFKFWKARRQANL
jgi:8-oxo-dGTP pyrophosphatase MutT (NUDIX family)